MSDLEYDILDELYFLIHFSELIEKLGLSDGEVKPLLIKMNRKGWLRVYLEPDSEVPETDLDLEVKFRNYYYLASKEGLKAHNQNA